VTQPRPAVLLDRDGVLNKTFIRHGVSHPPAELGEFELLQGVREATQRLAAAGWPLVVVTNQPDVARGDQSREAVEEMNQQLCRELPVLEVFACYHDGPHGCGCRKPKPGLLTEAARRWSLDLARSYMVGDRWSDVVAGQAAGCTTFLVETPYSGAERCRPHYRVRDLAQAAEAILASRHGW
jgi:D-glycero-D-manno-heptose 1,7-bisphosphate phosphatase